MRFILIFICIICVSNGADIDKYEVNQIEFTPLHDTIIFNDIADIMNELENSMNPQLNKHLLSGSDSNEDIEDLLSEYQHYLDKAHQQRINYLEKNKGKNKVPLIHREKFTKMKQNPKNMYDNGFNYYINTIGYPQKAIIESFKKYKSPNLQFSIHNKPVISDTLVQPHFYKEESSDVLTDKDKTIPELFPTIPKSFNEAISSCYCKVDEIPCKCGCKQCFILFDSFPTRNMNKYDNNQNIEIYPRSSKYVTQHKRNNLMDDKVNIRIKIDVQLPKISELDSLHQNNTLDGISPKELFSTINVPYPYLNFPIPIELLEYKKVFNKYDSSPMHKIGMHKKKKFRVSNNNKKHAGKKNISFPSVKLTPQTEGNNTLELNAVNNNSSSSNLLNKTISETILEKNKTLKADMKNNNISNVIIADNSLEKTNGSLNNIFLTFNISNNNDNDTNESFKIENSIETDFVEKDNITVNSLRSKREITERNLEAPTQESKFNRSRKFDKLEGDMELLYWPVGNKNVTLVKSKNITDMILDKETRKIKLNMSLDTIHSNRILALEQAIFGKVDWNDVDTVAPIFMSFVGKYVRGILTFCSQNICHSMKCAEKTCHHRICSPDDRFNHKGHCTGNNYTDSVAAMESVMDLPSNIVFNVVDILEDKMLGNIYGKATLCIISKCITFIASKKTFQKSKCIFKELSSTGHCTTIKNIRNI